MRGTRAFAALGAVALASSCLCPPPRKPQLVGAPEKYAVLVSFEKTKVDNQKDHSEFWYDTVLTYCALIENGFRAENIYVLYGDGQDFKSDLHEYRPPYCDGSHQITDVPLEAPWGAIAKDNVCNVLCCLATGRPATQEDTTCRCCAWRDRGIGDFSCRGYRIPQLGEDDFLLAWVKSHGNCLNSKAEIGPLGGSTIRDWELREMLTGLAPRRRVLLIEACQAGGWLDDLSDKPNVLLVSSDCQESSYNAEYTESATYTGATSSTKVRHGRLTYWIDATLRQHSPIQDLAKPPSDPLSLVSVQNAHDTTAKAIQSENAALSDPALLASPIPGVSPVADASGYFTQTPGINDAGASAPCIFIRLPRPGKDAQVLGRDHVEDDGTVPSDGAAWTKGPDLWVTTRDASAAGTPLSPKTASGTAYYELSDQGDYSLVTQVHNIGCTAPLVVGVAFYWAPLEKCSDRATWTQIGTLQPVQVPSATLSRQAVQVELKPSAINQGVGQQFVCLIAELNASGDPPDADARVYWDKNKVQVIAKVVADSAP